MPEHARGSEDRPKRRKWDVVADGIPQNKADAEFAGIPWEVCQKANARQQAVADKRRRAAANRDLLDRRIG